MILKNEFRSIWPGLMLVIGFTASLLCSPTHAHDVSYENDNTTIAHPSAHPDEEGDEIRHLVSSFRQTGNDQFLDEAWALLEPALENSAGEPHIYVDAAIVAQSRHEFDKAFSLINRALALNRRYDQAWLLLAALHLVRGNVDQAQNACRELQQVPALVAVTCGARVSIARGDNEKTLRILTAMLTAVDRASTNPEWLAWAFSVAGDAASSVDAELAISLYEQSLAITESTQVRAALVDVLLTSEKLKQAADVLNAGSGALPLAVRRLIVARRTGRENAVRAEIAAADREFRHWIADEDWLHAREMARFYLDVLERPAIARRLAALNASLQHEPEDLLLARRTR